MSKTLPQMTDEQAHAIAEQTVIGFGHLTTLIEQSVAIIEINGEIIQSNAEYQKREINRRLKLTQLTRDAGHATEHAARQSSFLARTSQRIEDRSGVMLSPADLLCGIINGIEDSDLDLACCGCREDVARVVENLLKQGINAIRDKNWEQDNE